MYHIVKPFSKQMLFLLKCPPVHEKIFSCKTYGTLISAQPTWSLVVVYIHHTLHYTEPVAGSLLHYQLAKCQLREHLKLTHFPVKRVNSVKLVHMWITLKSPRARESHSWFSTRSTGWRTVCGFKNGRKKRKRWEYGYIF